MEEKKNDTSCNSQVLELFFRNQNFMEAEVCLRPSPSFNMSRCVFFTTQCNFDMCFSHSIVYQFDNKSTA